MSAMGGWPICWPHAWPVVVAILPDDFTDRFVTFDGHELQTEVYLPRCDNAGHRDRDRVAYVYHQDRFWHAWVMDDAGGFDIGTYRSKGDAISAALCVIWQCRHDGWVARYPEPEPPSIIAEHFEDCACPIEPAYPFFS
jgi:hypothetical protein